MFKKLFCLLAVLAIAGTASADLLAYYDFSDAGALPTTENEGTAGTAANGILMNGASVVDLDPDERGVEHVLNLDYGDGTVHQFMDIGGGTSTGWANWNGEAGNLQPLTVAAWIYVTPGTWGNWRVIAGHGYEQSWTLATGTQPNPDADQVAWSAHRGLAAWDPIIGTTGVADGYWHYVAGTVVGPGLAELYIDGVLQGSKACWQGVNYYEGDVEIGSPGGTNLGYDFTWNGQMDNVAIYNEALTGTQIADLYIGTASEFRPTVPEPTTIALLGLGGLALLRRKR